MATIQLVELETVEGERGAAYAALVNRFWAEAVPGERPIPTVELQAEAVHSPPHRSVHRVMAAASDGEAAGVAALVVDRLRSQDAWLKFLFVAPEHRGRGIGSQLLRAVRDRASAAGKQRIRTMTTDGHAAGARFAEKAGGKAGLVVELNRCLTADLDPAELHRWVDRATERARGYSLVAFDGVCPEDHLQAFAAAVPIMNAAPGSDQREDFAPTPDQVRERMTAFVRQGNESWTVCVRDEATGRFVGYTELSFPSRRPWRAVQGDTGVHPDHRRLGLGRWLKAGNALRLLSERPEVEYIDSWNASGNAPMLSINRAMGFRVAARWQQWEVPV